VIVFTSGAAAMFIYYFGLKRVTASVATICELFWPLSAVILDYFINKNVLNYVQVIASIVLLFSFYKVVKSGKRKEIKFETSVVSGEGRGERLGFPTINLDKVDADIDYGVYLVKAKIDNVNYDGLLHFGQKETFFESSSLELYIKEKILGVKQKNVIINIVRKIRNINKFNNPNELKKQIEKDLKNLQ
jgi:hypothetical protein